MRAIRLLLALCTVASGALAESLRIDAVETIAVTVTDLEQSVEFFRDVLDFEKIVETEIAGDEVARYFGLFGARARVARLRLGDETIELVEFATPRGRPFPVDTRANDGWFQHVAVTVSDMDRAYERLRARGVMPASTAPQRLPDWNPNAGGIRAFYFRDPDGHFLEILEFPAGKGDPRWQREESLFLGIDHTAIVVDETEPSLAFYRDVLGLRVAGESENHGPEQEQLNGVFAARLRITTLRAPHGPGIELLDYLSPSDGRPAPRDARVSDVADWRVRLSAPSVGDAWTALRTLSVAFVSPGGVELMDRPLGFREGLLFRDRDGHALEIVER